MRSRVFGAIALILGVAALVVLFSDPKRFSLPAFFGGMVMAGLGLYYLVGGKTAASVKEYILEGKFNRDDAPR